jgi:mRNA-degrading endonuclease toxin of MazEF toxin-antitoxin module
MNAADLARLELAKRAYRSTEPNTTEVQRGVRKARLALRRPRGRTTWLTKTVVGVVLAMGGLAYAKPRALGELVQTVLHSVSNAPKRDSGSGLAVAPAALVAERAGIAAPVAPPAPIAGEQQADAELAVNAARNEPHPALAVREPAFRAKAPVAKGQPLTSDTAPSPAAQQEEPGSTSAFPDGAPGQATQPRVSDWGRVGSALARGDESRALAVLNQLSESEDRRTRDKADLGRAQLMMSNGNREQACATARSLTNRGAGSRIERQAQVLLKSCQR